MTILSWLGLTPTPTDTGVTAATRAWLDADADAREENSARERLLEWQVRAGQAEHELRVRNREYGRASHTIGMERMQNAFLRARIALLRSELAEWRRVHGTARPVDEQRGADEPLAAAIARHPSSAPDPADTAKVGDPDPTGGLRGSHYDQCVEKGLRGYVCTREPGHRGQHVAGNFDGVVNQVWPNTADVVERAEQYGAEIGQRDRAAAVEGAAITLRAHAVDTVGVHLTLCRCGWRSDDHARHVAEQLAAVGALGGGRFALSPGDNVSVRVYGTVLDGTWTGHVIDGDGSPVVEIEPVVEQAKAAT